MQPVTFPPLQRATVGLSAPTAQQLGTTLLLDAGDNRIANLAYANGTPRKSTDEWGA